MESVVVFGQRDGFGLTEPIHHQRHGGDGIVLFEERFAEKDEGFRRMETLKMLAPERDVSRCVAGFLPHIQCAGDFSGRFPYLQSRKTLDPRDFGASELIPPSRQLAHRVGNVGLRFGIPFCGGLFHETAIQVKNVDEHVDHIVDSVVVNRVVARKNRILRAESQKRPGIGERAAVYSPVEKFFNLGDPLNSGSVISPIGEKVSLGEETLDPADNPRRGDRNNRGLLFRRFEVPHSGEDTRKVKALELVGSLFGQTLVQVLPRAAERLKESAGLRLHSRTHRRGKVQ